MDPNNYRNNSNNKFLWISFCISFFFLFLSRFESTFAATTERHRRQQQQKQNNPFRRGLQIDEQQQQQEEKLLAAKTKWSELIESFSDAEIPINYSYGYSDGENWDDEMIVTVENSNNITNVRHIYYYNDDEIELDPSSYYTVEGLFELIESALNDPSLQVRSVEYDLKYGHPKEFTIIYNDVNENDVIGTTFISKIIDPMTFYTVLQRDLDEHKKMWNDMNFINYEYTSEVSCYCMPEFITPKRIVVENGNDVSVTDMETKEDVFPNGSYVNITELFDDIQYGIDQRYHRIDVLYDRLYGFPTRFGYDADPGMMDEEQDVTISDFINNDDENYTNQEEEVAAADAAEGETVTATDGGVVGEVENISDISESSEAAGTPDTTADGVTAFVPSKSDEDDDVGSTATTSSNGSQEEEEKEAVVDDNDPEPSTTTTTNGDVEAEAPVDDSSNSVQSVNGMAGSSAAAVTATTTTKMMSNLFVYYYFCASLMFFFLLL